MSEVTSSSLAGGSPLPTGVLTPNRQSNFDTSMLSATAAEMMESSHESTPFDRKESYKMQRQSYRFEKKRAAREMLSTIEDPTVVVLADWLKVRGTLKSWTKVWCVLKPGLLLLYKSDKLKDWVGTVLLSTCKLMERPSKKDGFCFKLFHPLDQSIWAPKGPQGETIPAPIQPLPTSHLIFRVSSLGAGKCWMDALELALKCSSLLMRSMSTRSTNVIGVEPAAPGATPSTAAAAPSAATPPAASVAAPSVASAAGGVGRGLVSSTPHARHAPDAPWNESDCEKHFKDQDFDEASHSDEVDTTEAAEGGAAASASASPNELAQRLQQQLRQVRRRHRHRRHHRPDSESDDEPDDDDEPLAPLADDHVVETAYVEQLEEPFGSTGELTEELAEDNKSLIWFLVKQVRPGMDLSKVVLPTFILEPRSFLDKLSDYYYHADLLSRAVLEDDPFTRIKTVVQWYLSGFYKKPRGLKKPYNPILGEVFRCCWRHPQTGSTTFYIAEQVSHHPPVSALYVTNRQDGFTLSATILAKSKFYGNSLSALLEGSARLTLLPRGEDYVITMPYAHCKGILLGTLTMEMGGDVYIKCEKTGYRADIEFKLKPILGGADSMNYVTGKLRLGKETLATISGYWDDCIHMEDKRTGERNVLWHSTPEVRAQRLKRCTAAAHQQMPFESERLWSNVSAAIRDENQELATSEKTVLEEAQRAATRDRASRNETWVPRCFELDPLTETWQYRHADVRPWDRRNDLVQYEADFVVATRTRHRTPVIRAASISASVASDATDRSAAATAASQDAVARRPSRRRADGSVSSSAEGDVLHSSDDDSRLCAADGSGRSRNRLVSWAAVLQRMEEHQVDVRDRLQRIHNAVQVLTLQAQQQQREQVQQRRGASRDLCLLAVITGLCHVIFWLHWTQ